MTVHRFLALAVTTVLCGALYAGWAGFRLGSVEWNGAWAVLGGTWLWDLRYPLIPAYVVGVLWLAERVAARFSGRR